MVGLVALAPRSLRSAMAVPMLARNGASNPPDGDSFADRRCNRPHESKRGPEGALKPRRPRTAVGAKLFIGTLSCGSAFSGNERVLGIGFGVARCEARQVMHTGVLIQ